MSTANAKIATSFISDIKAVNGSLKDVPRIIQDSLKKDLIKQGFRYTEVDSLKAKAITGVLKNYNGNVLLAGISYDKKNGKHSCEIEKYDHRY